MGDEKECFDCVCCIYVCCIRDIICIYASIITFRSIMASEGKIDDPNTQIDDLESQVDEENISNSE